MTRILIIMGLAAGLGSAAALAHPTDVAYATRGECESAYAAASKLDRGRLVELGFFESPGAAQRTFRDRFRCEYDEDAEAWFIVDELEL